MSHHEDPILLIEDDEDIQFVITSLLESRGCVVRTARNGQEGLDLIEKEGLPGLILLDMRMPVMDGWQFARAFHEKYDRLVPIVVMTAASDPGERAEQVQAEGWISKPFTIDTFLRSLERFLTPRPKADSLHERSSRAQDTSPPASARS